MDSPLPDLLRLDKEAPRPATGLIALALSTLGHGALLGLAIFLAATSHNRLLDRGRAAPAAQAPTETVFEDAESSDSEAQLLAAARPTETPGDGETDDREEAAPAPDPAEVEPPAASAPPSARAARSTAPSTSASAPTASASAGGGGSAGPTNGDDPQAGLGEKAPNVAARFLHELPSYGMGVADWAALTEGEAGSITVTIELDERGKVNRSREPVTGGAKMDPTPGQRAIGESARRAVASMRATLALPDRPVGAGTVKLLVHAKVVDGAPLDAGQQAHVSSSFEKREATFVLESGRKVIFGMEILAVDPA